PAVGAGMNQAEMLARFAREANFDCFLLAGRYTLLDQVGLKELLPLCAERGIAIIAGGVFNSGILADPTPGTHYNYKAAPDELVQLAGRIKAVCERHGVSQKAAAIQFPLGHPAVQTVLTGCRSVDELNENVEAFQAPIPPAAWDELKADGLLVAAAENEFIAGVVGWVDLTDRSVAKTLAGLRRSEGGSFLVGIRHQVHDEPDPTWLLREDVQHGIAAVGEAGLAYDVLVRTRELPAALKTVKRHPQIRFVIDHAAKPRIAAGAWDSAWEEALAPLSELPNVTCKVSGLFTEADWKSWKAEHVEPYVRRVIDWFGADRCMFGSDWPVSLLAASYKQVVTTMRDLVANDDQIMGGTAAKVYGLS